jgi:hypothetical protein
MDKGNTQTLASLKFDVKILFPLIGQSGLFQLQNVYGLTNTFDRC